MRDSDGIVLTRAEITALADFVAAQKSRTRTFHVVSLHNVKYVSETNGSRYRLTPERLG